MQIIVQSLVAALALVGPVFAISLLFGISKDGSPFERDFWTS